VAGLEVAAFCCAARRVVPGVKIENHILAAKAFKPDGFTAGRGKFKVRRDFAGLYFTHEKIISGFSGAG
jgi:hypothetical protein